MRGLSTRIVLSEFERGRFQENRLGVGGVQYVSGERATMSDRLVFTLCGASSVLTALVFVLFWRTLL